MTMRLSIFILSNLDEILCEWEKFAATLAPLEEANRVELRDHAAAVLAVIAVDLEQSQAEDESIEKSHGQGPREKLDTAAETHAETRLEAGLDGNQLIAEYRALRSSVLRLWAREGALTTPQEIEDMVRFNEAVDQALGESMARYAKLNCSDQDDQDDLDR